MIGRIMIGCMVWGFVAPVWSLEPPTPDETNRGWLGVSAAAPDDALAKQLSLDGKGLLVVDVAKNSPAQAAGLEQYDVIVEFGGQPVATDAEAFARTIGDRGSGTEIPIAVIRQAKRIPLTVTLASRPNQNSWEWVYGRGPREIVTNCYAVTGRVLERGPEGQIRIDEMGNLCDLPREILTYLPEVRQARTELWNQDGSIKKKIIVKTDHASYEFEQRDNDPEIVVRRQLPDSQDQPDETTYADLDALRRSDAEAYGGICGSAAS